MRRLFILLSLLLVVVQSSLAVPAKPCTKQIRLQDGSLVTATLCGDENVHFYRLPDGRLAVADQGEVYRVVEREELQDRWSQRLQQRNQRRVQRKDQRRAEKLFEGQKKGLVILVNFTDQRFTCSDLPQVTYNNFFNKRGYNEFGMTGSVRDYFLDQSYGKLDIQFDVIGPVTLSRNMAYYGDNRGQSHDSRPGEMAAEACKKVDPQVNFADYDWDGDGTVDQVFLVYAGYGEAQGGPAASIWPHEWALSASDYGQALTQDGVTIDTYACSCELRGNKGTTIDGIGSACHEFSHCMGLPDMYDTSGDSFGMGNWDLMCSGNYNDDSRTPSGYTAYERWVSGWLEPVEINREIYIQDMKPIEDEPEAYILYNDADHNEFYLLENRQQKGWDAAQQGHGLLVVHVDYDSSAWWHNAVNTNPDHQRMTIIPADGVASASSLVGDPFPGALKKTSLGDTTVPAATLYNQNADGSYFMGKPLDDIVESSDGRISFAAMRGVIFAPEVFEPQMTSPTSFRATWSEVADAKEYEITVTERLAPFATPEEAIMISEKFAGCYSKSAGMSNISGRLDSYLSTPGFTGEYLYTSPNLLKVGRGSNLGKLTTPLISMPNNGDVTIKLHLKPDAVSDKNLVFLFLNVGEKQYTASLKLTTEDDIVLHAEGIDESFSCSIYSPNIIFYVSELTVYDGTFSDEQLGVESNEEESDIAAGQGALRVGPRRLKQYTYTSSTNSYEFTGVDSGSIFYYRVRALTSLGYSRWSEEKVMDMRSASPVLAPVATDTDASWYDLQGRRVEAPKQRGIYIRGGKKVLVR